MNLSDMVTIPTHVMAREVGDEVVILDLVGGAYYGLDAVGVRIWQLLGEGKKPQGICETLLAEFEVQPEVLEADVLRLLEELRGKGLILVS